MIAGYDVVIILEATCLHRFCRTFFEAKWRMEEMISKHS